MSINVAQHYVQVVGTPTQDGELRVRRVYADVLVSGVTGGGTTHNESVNNALALTDSASRLMDYARTPNHDLGLTDATTYKGSPEQSVNNTLNLTHNVLGGRDMPRAVSNAISFTSLGGLNKPVSPANTLTLTDVLVWFNYIGDREPVGNVLNLTHAVTTLSAAGAENTLNLTQSVVYSAPLKQYVSHHIYFVQSIPTPIQVTASNTLYFAQIAGIPLPTQHVSHTLNFVQDSPIGRFDQTLNLTQNVTFAFAIWAANTLNLSDSVTKTSIYLRPVEHTNILGHSLAWYEDTPCDKKNYTPFQGENTINTDFTAPRETLQDPQGDTGNFSLYQPYLGTPTSEVVLRKPEMDNRDRNAQNRVNRETRGGKMFVYADPNWPKVRTLAVTIIGLTETQVDDLQTFMQSTLGQEIGLTDWEGRLWKGVITNPDEVATQDGRGMWTVTFEFEGEMLTVEQPEGDDGSQLNLTQSVTAVIV